jgi:polyphosphate kinase 2
MRSSTACVSYNYRIGKPAKKAVKPRRLSRKQYDKELLRLQTELVYMQEWIVANGKRLVVLFEGRDTAGKDGVIKRINAFLNPRVCQVVAVPTPTEREQSQWFFQHYVPHLPAAGEIVLFDRSWYNRAGVERVMGFCTDAEYEEFFRSVPEFEKMLIRSGIQLVKYWFSIPDEEQEFRFRCRINDPLKQWKLSPVDLASLDKWDQYTQAKETMFGCTDLPAAPWTVVKSNDKRRARLGALSNVLSLIPYPDRNERVVGRPDPLIVGPAALLSGGGQA